jgi:Zn-dependent protease
LGGSFRIGTIRGIPIRIHFTFLLILPFLAMSFGRVIANAALAAGVPPDRLAGPSWAWGTLVALALFASVLVHELAHSLYALRKGGRVRDITLLVIGGVSQISEPPRGARQEAMMAFVGPLTSLGLGAALFAIAAALRGTASFNLQFAFFHLATLNVALGLFNLLPAFPMDGGRVLRGLLVGRMGLIRATRVAAGLGMAFAALFAFGGVASGNLFLALIGFFVFVGAQAESRSVLVKTLLGELRVRDFVTLDPRAVSPSSSLDEVAERMIRERRRAFPVVDGERVIGVVSLDAVRRGSADDRGRRTAGEAMWPTAGLDAGEELLRALPAFAESRATILPVVEDGRLVGVLAHADVARGLELRELEVSRGRRRRWRRDAEQPG